MLHKSHAADEQRASMHRKQQDVLTENQELKGKLIDLRGKLMDKSVQLNTLEGNTYNVFCNSNLNNLIIFSEFGWNKKGSQLYSEGVVH